MPDPDELRYCTGTTYFSTNVIAGGLPLLACNMGPGSSGGPWISDLQFNRGWGYIIGNISSQPPGLTGQMRSPYFDLAAFNVYNAARNA